MVGQYLEITEIYERARQGRTEPFRCKASDGEVYFVKGKSATLKGLISEWLGAYLGKAFGLPIPDFAYAEVVDELSRLHGEEAIYEFDHLPAFASQSIEMTYELTYGLIAKVEPSLQCDILMFDAWVKNNDRTLTANGGNPNLIWDGKQLHVIDHNLIFDAEFSISSLHETHVFREQLNAVLGDHLQRGTYQTKMQQALGIWETAWQTLPDEWQEMNEELCLFDQDAVFQQLQQDAEGALWERLAT